MTWQELSKYNQPADYPIGGLEEMLEPEVRQYLDAYNLHEMKYTEIHDLLLKIRSDLKLPPWHLVTPLLQAHAYSDWLLNGESTTNTVDIAWFTVMGGSRPLSLFNHKYENTYPVCAALGSGERVYVGELILKMDDASVFRFWGTYNDRLNDDCTKVRWIKSPTTGENLFTSSVLAHWEKRFDVATGEVVIKVRVRMKRRKTEKEEKAPVPKCEEQPDLLVAMSTNPLSHAALEKRKLLINLFLQSSTRASGTLTALETLSKVLADYAERLEGDDIPVSVPDTVLIACWSFVQMHGDSDVGRAAHYWYDALTRTDSTRVSLGGSIVP